MYKCPICGCVFTVPEIANKTMLEDRGNKPNLNSIIVCCPNNDGHAMITGGEYDSYEDAYLMFSHSVGITYVGIPPFNISDIKGVFIGEKVEENN